MVPGLVNLDFADVKSVMTEMGDAVMGTGISSGKNRAVEAAQQAISSPLLEDASIAGAGGVLVNVTGGADLTLHEINEAAMIINDAIGVESNMIFGAVIDDELKDQAMITVIATGIRGAKQKVERERPREKKRSPREADAAPARGHEDGRAPARRIRPGPRRAAGCTRRSHARAPGGSWRYRHSCADRWTSAERTGSREAALSGRRCPCPCSPSSSDWAKATLQQGDRALQPR